MFYAPIAAQWLASRQAVMMTVLIFLSVAHRTDNDPPEGLRIYIRILIPVAQPGKLRVPLSPRKCRA